MTSHQDRQVVKAGSAVDLKGIAFNGGGGIARVMLSTDDGATWKEAALGEDLGRYSFREWRMRVTLAKGAQRLKVRAFGSDGESQPIQPLWQPAGYMRNVVETVTLEAR